MALPYSIQRLAAPAPMRASAPDAAALALPCVILQRSSVDRDPGGGGLGVLLVLLERDARLLGGRLDLGRAAHLHVQDLEDEANASVIPSQRKGMGCPVARKSPGQSKDAALRALGEAGRAPEIKMRVPPLWWRRAMLCDLPAQVLKAHIWFVEECVLQDVSGYQ